MMLVQQQEVTHQPLDFHSAEVKHKNHLDLNASAGKELPKQGHYDLINIAAYRWSYKAESKRSNTGQLL